ncbi:MAG: tyrosine-type recombinase/integrase [Clostridiales bacterium]|nr:tyrosine-type recombinase/integrase [Clostridiales bacterium]
MGTKRKDSRGRNLRDGEDQMKNGRYRFRYTDEHGGRNAVYSWKLVATDRPPAGKKDGLSFREKEAQIEQDGRDGINSRAASKITLNDMFALYMSDKRDLKQSTATNYRYMYTHYVADSLGKKPLASIKYSTVKAFFNDLIDNRGFKPNSVEIIHTVLHPVFTLAIRDGYIRTNPTDGIIRELKKAHNWEKPKRHALTEAQQQLFIDFLSTSEIYNHWLPLFTVFLGTGCRVGEIIGLRWEDCDFTNGVISINHNLIYRVQDNGKMEFRITTPKTKAGCRTVPMLDEVRTALMAERRRQLKEGYCVDEIDGYSGFCFSNRSRHVHCPHALNSALERIRLACNEQEIRNAQRENREPVIIPHFSVHNLRHTFCTRFCENETNIKVIQEIMGHSDIGTTMNIYAEATESKKKEAFDRLEGKIKIS